MTVETLLSVATVSRQIEKRLFLGMTFGTSVKTGRFSLVLESRLQKQALLDLPRPSRDREEGLDIISRRVDIIALSPQVAPSSPK